LIELSGELDFPIYQLGDEVTEVGVLVHQQHCICILPKNDRNTMIAKQLEQQYY
jgi:hypothetical protein